VVSGGHCSQLGCDSRALGETRGKLVRAATIAVLPGSCAQSRIQTPKACRHSMRHVLIVLACSTTDDDAGAISWGSGVAMAQPARTRRRSIQYFSCSLFASEPPDRDMRCFAPAVHHRDKTLPVATSNRGSSVPQRASHPAAAGSSHSAALRRHPTRSAIFGECVTDLRPVRRAGVLVLSALGIVVNRFLPTSIL